MMSNKKICPLSMIACRERILNCEMERCTFWAGECVIKMYFMGILPTFDEKKGDFKEVV